MNMSKKLRLLTDQAIFEKNNPRKDALSFSSYAEVIKNVILGTDGPFTIGIFGEWGSGKTSLMKMVEHSFLENHDSNIIPIWFNAWKFERVEHPIIPLIAMIISQLEKNKKKMKKLYKGGNKLIQSLRAIAYGFSATTKLQIPGVGGIEAGFAAKDMIDRNEKFTYSPLLEKSFYDHVFEALDEINLNNNNNSLKILVIIDDLDRCFPENSIKLLESIKLVLSQPGFFFVLGISSIIVEGYLQYKYEEIYGIKEFRGSAYLDKIIQLSFDIPPHSTKMEKFAQSLIEQLDSEDDKQQLSQITAVIGIACNDNPRTVVRFINRLLIDKAVYASLLQGNTGKPPVTIGYFAVTRSLQQQWKFFYDLIIHTEDNKLCEKILSWKENPEKLKPNVKNSDDENKIIKTLNADSNLKKLLYSRIGQEWLSDLQLRNTTIDFIITQPAIIQDDNSRQLDFSGKNLSNKNLTGKNFKGANLKGANLQGAILSGANLSHSDLRNADLEGAFLNSTDLNFADLSKANLCAAKLRSAQLIGTNLDGADLKRAILTNTELLNTSIKDAYIKETDFRNTDIRFIENFRSAKNFDQIISDKTTYCTKEQVEGTALSNIEKVTIKEKEDDL